MRRNIVYEVLGYTSNISLFSEGSWESECLLLPQSERPRYQRGIRRGSSPHCFKTSLTQTEERIRGVRWISVPDFAKTGWASILDPHHHYGSSVNPFPHKVPLRGLSKLDAGKTLSSIDIGSVDREVGMHTIPVLVEIELRAVRYGFGVKTRSYAPSNFFTLHSCHGHVTQLNVDQSFAPYCRHIEPERTTRI